MGLKFTKMHGLGNDFVVIDAIHQKLRLNEINMASLANRHTGIGFDQCLVVEAGREEGVDFHYRIFNANGQEVGQCGNGARCLGRFLQHYGLTDKSSMTIATSTTRMQLFLNEDGSVSVNMGKPRFVPKEIPLAVEQQASLYSFQSLEGSIWHFHALNVGNPHAVILVNDVDEAPVAALGKEISEHSLFPEQVNVGFMQLTSENHIKLRVYERGCGETLACGSGAVAAAVVGRCFYQLTSPVNISLPGGDLTVSWSKMSEDVFLTGPATFVYEGELMPCI
ncbi:diaminopimelate epimerase [Legionella israelensis]|uniref:diaminopimelate epimerase n=1 Tax=Legionella israelensis TaxID=454 RepID=UPI00117ED272|nr:diaminopimelate epimerase [Legionella israelensis]QDP71194.1 diaminopimelate epimerase [Legionella israelensis]